MALDSHSCAYTGEMSAYIATALDEQTRGVSLPFALVEKASGQAIGSTRYGNIDRTHHRVEIGWTWVAPPCSVRL